MRSIHIIKRGNKYHYVCRIPSDLRHYFPVKAIWRSLKTSDLKVARLLAATHEHTTQGVFMRLRSGHLDENAMRQMISSYLGIGLELLEAKLMRRTYSDEEELVAGDCRRLQIVNGFAPIGERIDLLSSGRLQLGANAMARETELRAELNSGDFQNADEARELAKQFGYELHRDDQEPLQIRMLQAQIRLAKVEKLVRQEDDWAALEDLRDYISKQKTTVKPRFFLGETIADYLAQYDDKKILLNSLRAVKRETAFILKTFGKNTEMSNFNSKNAVKQLTKALNKCRKSNGNPWAPKTKSEYLKRLSSIVDFLIEKHELDVTNKTKKSYKTVGPIKSRDSYERSDLKKVEDSLCLQPITHYDQPRNDRFWITLIAILQGYRKAAIVTLEERHINLDEHSDIPFFDLALDESPENKLRISCPVHPLLIQCGFLKWFNMTKTGDPNRKLFEDDPESFGQWFKHYFCVWTEELRISKKERNEMSGHAYRYIEDDQRSKHYLNRTRIARMRENQNLSMQDGCILMKDLDWERLEARAKELFGLE